MKEPTQVQVEEFWEGYGFTRVDYVDVAPIRYGKWGNVKCFEHYPDIDLNSLSKWAVPKLLEEYNIESYSFKQRDDWYYSETNIWRKGSTQHNFEVLHDEHIAKHFEQGADLDKVTALALFWALDKAREASNG